MVVDQDMPLSPQYIKQRILIFHIRYFKAAKFWVICGWVDFTQKHQLILNIEPIYPDSIIPTRPDIEAISCNQAIAIEDLMLRGGTSTPVKLLYYLVSGQSFLCLYSDNFAAIKHE